VALCQEFGLPWEADPFGNLYVRLPKRHREGSTVVFSAHMDHPGIEVVGTDPPTGQLLGGVRRECFEHEVPIRLFDARKEVAGVVVGSFADASGTRLRLVTDQPVGVGAFGVFDVGSFREDGDLLHLRAADDLAGCAAILYALARCAADGVSSNAIGLFTRCEETGLVGATLAARGGWLPANAIVVSLEASRELPGAEMGGGPVIRVGDRAMTFHPDAEAVLRRAGDRLVRQQPSATVQRQLMSGGVCEATAFLVAGYATTGIALPLGNYHNMTPDLRIGAEYIHRHDLVTGAALIVAAIEETNVEPSPEQVAVRLQHQADAIQERLRKSAGDWRVQGVL
jgi:putative aminopeptidase FrvX